MKLILIKLLKLTACVYKPLKRFEVFIFFLLTHPAEAGWVNKNGNDFYQPFQKFFYFPII